jgi:hypothetical protein
VEEIKTPLLVRKVGQAVVAVVVEEAAKVGVSNA